MNTKNTIQRSWHVALTGASSGIGLALAHEFSKHGHRLSLISRRKKNLDALQQDLKSPSSVFAVDLSDLKSVTSWVDQAQNENGPIDVLINNAGVQIVAPTPNVSIDEGEALLNLDLLAPIRLIHTVLPQMLNRKFGHIVNIASMCSVNPVPGMFHYNAAKAGLAAASEGLRAELKGTGVIVTTVYPGPITTPLEQAAREKLKKTFMVQSMPTGSPEKLASLVYASVIKGRDRVVYPAFYGSARHFSSISQWITEKFSPGFSE